MGMYTELDIQINIDPTKADLLKSLMDFLLDGSTIPSNLPDHPFFKCDRAPGFLSRINRMGQSTSQLIEEYGGSLILTIDICLKNYDHEIQKFLDWIFPYTVHEGKDDDPRLVGCYRYEEDEYYSSVFQISNGFKISQNPFY